jgi:hypothetical protein
MFNDQNKNNESFFGRLDAMQLIVAKYASCSLAYARHEDKLVD